MKRGRRLGKDPKKTGYLRISGVKISLSPIYLMRLKLYFLLTRKKQKRVDRQRKRRTEQRIFSRDPLLPLFLSFFSWFVFLISNDKELTFSKYYRFIFFNGSQVLLTSILPKKKSMLTSTLRNDLRFD